MFINRKKSGELFHAEQVIRPFFGADGRITHFVSIARDVSERIRELETLTRAATHDSLTDLPNRRLFFDRLGQALGTADGPSFDAAVERVVVDRGELTLFVRREHLPASQRRLTRADFRPPRVMSLVHVRLFE